MQIGEMAQIEIAFGYTTRLKQHPQTALGVSVKSVSLEAGDWDFIPGRITLKT